MLLDALKAYGAGLSLEDQTPPMYARRRIRYVIDLDADGVGDSDPIDTATDTRGPGKSGHERIAPVVHTRTGTGTYPCLLVDSAEYVLGQASTTEARAQRRHSAFLDQVSHCAAVTGSADVAAVLAWLVSPAVERMRVLPLDPAGTLTFRVDGAYPFDLPVVRHYWASINGALVDDELVETGETMECMVCGQQRPSLKTMPTQHRGIPGTTGSGASLVGVDKEAYWHYGRTRATVAPICHVCAETVGKGLNALLRGEDTHLRDESMVSVFWVRGGAAPAIRSLLDNPQPDDVRALLEAAHTARPSALGLAEGQFYLLALAGNAGRLSVQDWIDVPVGEALRHLAAYFRRQGLLDQAGQAQVYPIWRLTQAATRAAWESGQPPQKKPAKPPEEEKRITRALYRVALTGTPLPIEVLAAAVYRAGRDRLVSPARAALIKLALLSRSAASKGGKELMALDLDDRRPGYLCGRLLAVLEWAQEGALGEVGAGVRDRYYGSASTTPAMVFPLLLEGVQPHISKMSGDPRKKGLATHMDRLIGEILGGLPGTAGGPPFPRLLDTEGQGLFALGFYHQRSARYAPRAASGESGPATSSVDESDAADDVEEQPALMLAGG